MCDKLIGLWFVPEQFPVQEVDELKILICSLSRFCIPQLHNMADPSYEDAMASADRMSKMINNIKNTKKKKETTTTTPSPSVEDLNKQIAELQKSLADATKPSAIRTWFSTYLYQIFLYLPNALVLFGPIIDTINQEVRYTLVSIIGILSIFLNRGISSIISYFLKESVISSSLRESCTVPGFEHLDSYFSPQGIVLPASIFTYLLIDLGLHRTPSQNLGTAILMFLFIGIQALVMNSNGCFGAYYFKSSFFTVFVALIIGAFCGLFGWIGVRFAAPQRLPSASGTFSGKYGATAPTTQKSGNPLGSSASDVATCSPPNDQDQFVCEAYKDGEVITSTIV